MSQHFKYSSNMLVLGFICFLGIEFSYANDSSSLQDTSSVTVYTNLTTTNPFFSTLESFSSDFPVSDIITKRTVTSYLKSATGTPKKRRRRKKGRNVGRRRKANPVNEGRFGNFTDRTALQRTVKKRTGKHKRRRRKPLHKNANILEIVMAKGSSPTSDSKLNNSIVKDIIKKLNENPETSLEEFKDIHANTTLNVLWLENLVDSPRNFTSSKNLKASETTESTRTITETTTRSNTKQKIRKRRRKLKKRKRKGKPAQTKLEMATSTEMFLPKISYLNNSSTNAESVNLSNIHSKESFSSTNFWAENLVAPIPITSGVPTSFTNTAKLPSGTGNKTINVKYGRNVGRCRKNRGGCAHICNPKGPNRCSCLEGFFLARDRKSCYDINECKINNGGCEMKCVNTLGSFECHCPGGLRIADDMKSCEDINECLLRNGHGPCQDMCENTHGSYKCSCERLKGTKLSGNGYSCEDLNECTEDNGGCSHECINTMGRAFCNCPYGLELSPDMKTCQDINECEDEDIKKLCGEHCINTLASYQCTGHPDFQNDQPLDNIACKPLFPPTKGFITCSRNGRVRTTNSPGTICELVCPVGYRMFGEYHVTCGLYGEWEGQQEGECRRAPPPELSCPSSQYFTLEGNKDKILVQFPSPITNINWKYVKASPPWAKGLRKTLGRGEYNIHFTVQDPSTKMFSSCSFDIIVTSN